MKRCFTFILCVLLLVTVLTGCDKDSTIITSDLDISGFVPPSTGETAVTAEELSLNSEECHIKEVQWFDDATGKSLKNPITFEGGQLCYAKITLVPNAGFAFGTSPVTLNGGDSLLRLNDGSVTPDEITVTTVCFSISGQAEELELVLDAPNAGASVKAFSEANFLFSSGTAPPLSIPAQLFWTDENGEFLQEGACFKAGTYQLHASFNAPESWLIPAVPFTPADTTLKTGDAFSYRYMHLYAERNVEAYFTVQVQSVQGTLHFELPQPQPGQTAATYQEGVKVQWQSAEKTVELSASPIFIYYDEAVEEMYIPETEVLPDGGISCSG